MSSEYKVSRPYAKAIFDLAFSQKKMAEWSEMLKLATVIIQDQTIHKMLKDPTQPTEDIVKLIISIADEGFSSECKNLIITMGHFKRLLFIPIVSELYEEFRAEAEKTIEVELVSAFSVSEDMKDRFTQALKKRLQREVCLSCQEDPSILAGAIIRSGDLLIDGSLRGKLSKLGDSMGVFQ